MTPKKNPDESTEVPTGTLIEVTIRKIKVSDIAEKKTKPLKGGITLVRVRKTEKKFFTHKYLVPLTNLGLDEHADKKAILDRLNDPKNILEKNTRDLVASWGREYDGVIFDGRFNRTQYRTKRFKPRMKAIQVKRKAL